MKDQNLLLVRGDEVHQLLTNKEQDIMESVSLAYQLHRKGQSDLPHSTFLHFPGKERERIISLVAFLGSPFNLAGTKWIASFPGNLEQGLERASASLILNSVETGVPLAIMESSVISAKRTAAAAALAAKHLLTDTSVSTAGLVGTGLINFETARFLLAACPHIKSFLLFDLDQERATQFREKMRELPGPIEVNICTSLEELMGGASLISLATSAVKPYIDDLSMVAPGTVILHTSLRDVTPDVILNVDNVVDDLHHVCRANTSIHLAKQKVGHTDFVRCPLADILCGSEPPRRNGDQVSMFSPFGLGILDIAVASVVYTHAQLNGVGTHIDGFLPSHWMNR